MLDIIGIKCKGKFFVTNVIANSYRLYSFLEHLMINGNPVKRTFHPNWGVIEDEPKIVQKYVKQPDINQRFELIDPALKSDRIKLVLKRDEVLKNGDDDFWKKEFNSYRFLYTSVSDKQPDILKDVEFKYETIMEVNEVEEYKEFAYNVQKTQWTHGGLRKLKENEVQHQLIDEIIFPDILLPARPCFLTPKQSFDIIREYVKQHINYKIAFITSDFNFCFTVKKVILPIKLKTTITNTINPKPKEIECFNMAPKKYQNYKVITGFRGKNQKDLKKNIDNYCKKLITFINKPLTVCPNCKGYGVIPKNLPNEEVL